MSQSSFEVEAVTDRPRICELPLDLVDFPVDAATNRQFRVEPACLAAIAQRTVEKQVSGTVQAIFELVDVAGERLRLRCCRRDEQEQTNDDGRVPARH